MENTYKTLFVISLLVALFLFGYIFYCQKNPAPQVVTRTITDTIFVDRDRIKTHTITKSTQIVDTFYICKYDTVYLESLPIEHKVYQDTITQDSTRSIIRASYSGFCPTIDSLYVQTEITSRSALKCPRKKFGWAVTVGPSVGYGAGLNGLTPYVGLGVSFGWGYIIK